ncbi:MAG TPA: tetratricopeptide repeat protein [Verrucomicrobiae bacterium]|jgi:tetratricopeptide (TPR) repeat protein
MSARSFRLFKLLAFSISTLPLIAAEDIESARHLLINGKYEEVIETAEKAINAKDRDEEWRTLLMRAQMSVGKYPEALQVATNALRRYSSSIRMKLAAYDVLQANGQAAEANSLLEEMNEVASARYRSYREPEEIVALGNAAVLLGADPKLVLDNFFEPAKKANPKLRDSYLAAGELALEKQDFAVAAKYFNQAIKEHPDDPDIHFGLARAFAPDDRPQMVKSLERVFELNPRHVPALLLLVDHLIDSEAYTDAEVKLKDIEQINPNHPELWAFRAVIAHLNAKSDEEKADEERALKYNSMNPRVAYLIGLKLSQKYRFAEGSEFQRKALQWNARYLPSKFQLAQDLLRLGQEDEGWALAEAVHKADAYNVGAYNLVTLKDTFAKFETFTNEHFVLRMNGHERSVFGDDVKQLLERAHAALTAKYHSTLEEPTVVEVFPAQKDFAIRTFGMPGGEGYLGVCFGRVITANSPAAQAAHPSNWQAMLWHEFCHVVTLQLTKNRMPRWLSEGISVYEERIANPTWGQTINARYRELIMKGDLKPIDELSAAFMSPDDDLHLQFAYYQSMLVVEFIVQKFGNEALQKILHDLADGVLINEAIEKNTTKLADLNKDFKEYAKSIAEGLAPKLDWTKPKFTSSGDIEPAWVASHPNNYWALDEMATDLIELKKFEEAKEPLKKIIAAYPDQTGPHSAARRLAEVHRALGEADQELKVLRKFAARDGEALDAYIRLMELDADRADWKETLENANRARAVNPLILPPNQKQFLALQKLDHPAEAIVSGERLLQLNPPDPTGVHYELAELMADTAPDAARAHVVQALEEAPRFRAAQKLLLKLGPSKQADAAPTPAAPEK